MQQFWYRTAAEYHAHVQQMSAAGWAMVHYQTNNDGTASATWAPPPGVDARPRETQMAVYDNDGAYRRGVAEMTRRGWQVSDVAMTQNGRPLAKILVMGIFAKQRIKYTVIYMR